LSTGAELVHGRRQHGGVWIPSLANEFSYLLSKKILKGGVTPPQADKLRALVSELGARRAAEAIESWCGRKWARRLAAACGDGTLTALIVPAGIAIRTAALMRHPVRFAGWYLSEGLRRASRWLKPTGLWVAVLGPDGSGKSTLLDSLPATLGILFRRTRRFHFRPGLLARRQGGGATTEPHGQAARNPFTSVLVLAIWLLDHLAGYWLIVRPALTRSSLVLFDRFLHDLLADPRRYRYAGPQWMVRMACRVAPEPHIILVLDAEEDRILARKQEVSRGELERQRTAYQALSQGMRQAVSVDSGLPAGRVARVAAGVAVEALAKRFQQREIPYLRNGRPAHYEHSYEQ
jgi:thymidylate kinase